jgi:hypothetical protein
MIQEDPVVSKAKRILRWLVARDHEQTITKKICFDAHHPHVFKTVHDIEACLKTLADHYLLKVVKQVTSGKRGGRPTELIELNPAIRRAM